MESIRPPPKDLAMVNGFKKKRLNINKSHTHTPRPNKKKKEGKKHTRYPRLLARVEPETALTAQISLLQSHHKHALLLNKQKNNNFFETTKQKTSTDHFSDNTQLLKINQYWEGKGAIPTGLVSHKCMWVGAGHLSLLQKWILIFNL